MTVPSAGPVRGGAQLLQLGDQVHHLQEVIETLMGGRRHRHGHHIAAVVLDHHLMLRELLPQAVRVGAGQVNLVHGDQERGLGSPEVRNRFHGLGLYTVVGSHDQDRQVGNGRAARAQRRERLVARRVEERDRPAVVLDLIGADVLRDAPGFTRSDLGLAQGVEDGGLAVIHVPHHGYDRRPRREVRIRLRLGQFRRRLCWRLRWGGSGRSDRAVGSVGFLDPEAKVAGHERGRRAVQLAVDGGYQASAQQLFEHHRGADPQQFGKLADTDPLRDSYSARDDRSCYGAALGGRRVGSRRRPARTARPTRPAARARARAARRSK